MRKVLEWSVFGMVVAGLLIALPGLLLSAPFLFIAKRLVDRLDDLPRDAGS